MKKILILSIIFALAFTGCTSTKSAEEAKEPEFSMEQAQVEKPEKVGKTKIIGADGIEMPDWVNGKRSDETFIYGIGKGKLNTRITSEKAAYADAMTQLSRNMVSTIESTLKTYVGDKGTASDTDNLGITSNVLDEFQTIATQTTMVGAYVVDSWVAADGTVSVLVSMPKENYKKLITAAFEKSTEKAEKEVVTDKDKTAAETAIKSMKDAIENMEL